MSSYFDSMNRAVAEAAQQFEDDGEFLANVRDIEEQVFREVTVVTGDREFPDDLRERIMGAFAVQAVYQPGALGPTERTRDYVVSMRMSRVIETLHTCFHELAQRRIVTRFGRFSDSPTQISVLRDEWEEERS